MDSDHICMDGGNPDTCRRKRDVSQYSIYLELTVYLWEYVTAKLSS